MKKQLPQVLPYVMLALLAGLGLAGTIVFFRLRPPVNEMLTLLVLLSTTGAVSLLAARLAHRTGLLNRFGSVRWMLFASYGLAVGLILLNVWVMAKLMLVSQHYLRLASMVLGFSAVIAMGFGYVLSATVSGAVKELVNGANTLAEGDLSARVPVTGSNELSELARAFNEMAGRLAAMAEQEREMEQARRDLITWVSHDLRTPLTSLQVMIEALADGVASDEETVSRYLRTSMNELRALRGLIDDLFELARFDAGHLQIDCEMSSLHDLVSDTLESLRAQAERKQLTLSGEVDPDVDPVWLAPDKIQRVLSNLIGNAIRYTPPGGAVHLKARREDGQVTVSVRDNGPGIPRKDLPHVFEPFLRGEEARTRDLQEQGSDFDRGVGLGLAIAKAFVEAHAGTIEVESEEGAGSEFRFSVPRLPPAST